MNILEGQTYDVKDSVKEFFLSFRKIAPARVISVCESESKFHATKRALSLQAQKKLYGQK